MTTDIKYVTVINNVREVTLHAVADFEPFHTFVSDEAVTLYESNRQVELMISAVDSKYMGLRFQELSFSVAIASPEAPNQAGGYFLMHAFNSRSWFAMAERRFFRTPYYPAAIDFDIHHLRLSRNRNVLFHAKRSDKEARSINEYRLWEGKIHLPKAFRKQQNSPHYFHARLEGEVDLYDGTFDTTTINPSDDIPVLDVLNRSNFTIKEWHVRDKGTHGKSKTYHATN